MPLIKSKSKEAFKKNVKSEVSSGKPLDQALAIAYSMKSKKAKKMAHGGEVVPQNDQGDLPELKKELYDEDMLPTIDDELMEEYRPKMSRVDRAMKKMKAIKKI
jgi:hypothetical protein